MNGFLNISLFEKLINSGLVQNSINPLVFTYILCILRNVMLWPLMHLFYLIMYNCLYFYDRNRANSYDLRSKKIERFCYWDFWKDYWECNDIIFNLAPGQLYECQDCKACDKGNARCESIRQNAIRTQNFFKIGYISCIVLAVLMCNPFTNIKVLGFWHGLVSIAIAILINPLFVKLTYILFEKKSGRLNSRWGREKGKKRLKTSILFFREKHDNPYENIFEEMIEDGSLEYYYDNVVPESWKTPNPDAMGDDMSWRHQNNMYTDMRRAREEQRRHAQEIKNAIYSQSWWW